MVDITPPEIEAYAAAHSTPHDPLLQAVWEQTHADLDNPGMLTGALEGQFLQMLVFALDARRILEIGTYSGYSALTMAAAMPPEGRIVTCEVDERHAEVARRNIGSSPRAGMIEVRLGPALETIASLGSEGPFDFVFIDADKEHYPDYFEAVLPLLAERGLIAADNTLWSGRVLDEGTAEPSTQAIRRFNDTVASDPRVSVVMVPIRDGVTLIRRR